MITDITTVVNGDPLSIVSLALAKKQLHIEASFDEEDDLITSYIETSVEECENYIGGHILEKTVTFVMDAVQNPFVFESFPFKEITQIKYLPADGSSEVELPKADYSLAKQSEKVYSLRFKKEPQLAKEYNALTIVTKVGMTTIPKSFVQAVLLLVSDKYERREDRSEIPMTTAFALLRPYKKF